MPFSAIICASQAASDSPDMFRATLHFADQALIEYQVRQVTEAGASEVMVVVGAVTQPLSRAVDRLTADGIRVTLVRDMVTLLREAPREGDFLLVADGAVVPQRFYRTLAASKDVSLLVVEDGATTAGFERIGPGQRWAGIARISADVLFGTLDMIGDWDLESTLVRAAMQNNATTVPVPVEEANEGRLAIIRSQAEATLVTQALLGIGTDNASVPGDAGAERYVVGPLAARLAPMLLRSQVPAVQVGVAAIAIAAIGTMTILLHWPMMGLLTLFLALVVGGTAIRLTLLARRASADRWIWIVPQAVSILGIALAARQVGQGALGLYLAGLVAIATLALRIGRLPNVRPWAIVTPGSAILLLVASAIAGYLDFGYQLAVGVAIASLGDALIGRRRQKN